METNSPQASTKVWEDSSNSDMIYILTYHMVGVQNMNKTTSTSNKEDSFFKTPAKLQMLVIYLVFLD